ncbi:Heterokaryon incompatibility protein (HET) domain containing protein [Naviculisporaceae sp. PSN 640]
MCSPEPRSTGMVSPTPRQHQRQVQSGDIPGGISSPCPTPGGDPSETRDIVVDGLRVQVRSNLETALRTLAKKRPVQQGIFLWIDALCINQDDIGERNREVKRMRAIYQTARDVVVWLGEKSDNSGLAMELVKTLAKSCADGTDDALGRELRTSPGMFGFGAWRALGELFNRPYWERLWIMQEIAMGNSQTPFLCGDASVRWGQIYDGIYTFGSKHIDIFFGNIERECLEGGVRYAGLNRNKLIHLWEEGEVQAGKRPPQFLPMLDLARKSVATDPRDKVYGLLGLMPPEVAAAVEPDYEKPIAEVYLSFAKVWVTTTRNLDLLEQCTSPNNLNIPSWVPDWTNVHHFRLFSGRGCYNAAPDIPTATTLSPAGTDLIVEGTQLGDVDGLGASYYEHARASSGDDAMVQSTQSNNPYGDTEGLRRAIWQTLTGNRTPNGRLAPDSYQSLLGCPLELASDSDGSSSHSATLERQKSVQPPAVAEPRPHGGGTALGHVLPRHRRLGSRGVARCA